MIFKFRWKFNGETSLTCDPMSKIKAKLVAYLKVEDEEIDGVPWTLQEFQSATNLLPTDLKQLLDQKCIQGSESIFCWFPRKSLKFADAETQTISDAEPESGTVGSKRPLKSTSSTKTFPSNTKTLMKTLRLLESRVRHLKRIRGHRSSGETEKLPALIEKWRLACQTLIVDLMEAMKGKNQETSFKRSSSSTFQIGNPFEYDPDGYELAELAESDGEDGSSELSLKRFMQMINVDMSLVHYNSENDCFADV